MTLAGYELRTSEVFTVLSIFNAMQVNMEGETERKREKLKDKMREDDPGGLRAQDI